MLCAQTEEEKTVKVGFGRLFGMVKQDWPFLLSGGITSAILGCVMPLFAVILSTIITSLDPNESESKANNVRARLLRRTARLTHRARLVHPACQSS